MTIIPLLCVFTSSAYLYSDSMGQVPYTMLGSREQMGNRMVTVLPSKSLQSRENQKSKRQLQSGVVCRSWAQGTYTHSTMGAEVRPVLRIREGLLEEVINKQASRS